MAMAALPNATPAAESTLSPYTVFAADHLMQGRVIWLKNCETCHGYGIAGAPIPMEPEAWQTRLRQPMSVLYAHALEGFFGPDDTYMPPRGGNENLSDAEVRLAVDYVTTLAQHYIDIRSMHKTE